MRGLGSKAPTHNHFDLVFQNQIHARGSAPLVIARFQSDKQKTLGKISFFLRASLMAKTSAWGSPPWMKSAADNLIMSIGDDGPHIGVG